MGKSEVTGRVARRTGTAKHQDAAGMRGHRTRNQGGQLRETRSDKRVDTIEKQHGRDFAVRGDVHLGTLLARLGYDSVHVLLESNEGKQLRTHLCVRCSRLKEMSLSKAVLVRFRIRWWKTPGLATIRSSRRPGRRRPVIGASTT